MKIKKVWKFGTGQPIPEGAVYLTTVVDEQPYAPVGSGGGGGYRYVWHYFLVEVEEKGEK